MISPKILCRRLHTVALIVVSTSGFQSLSPALHINTSDQNPADRYYRFSSGTTNNPNFLFANLALDLSGISTNTGATMITPQHFVGATHAMVGPGATVTFINRAGETKSYTVASSTSISTTTDKPYSSDLAIGTLTAPIPASDQVSFYSVVDGRRNGNDYTWYATPSLKYVLHGGGRYATAPASASFISYIYGTNLSGTQTHRYLLRWYALTYNPPGLVDEALFSGGDSGYPLGLVYNGQYTVLGANSAVSNLTTYGYSWTSFLPAYIESVNEYFKKQGSAYRLSVLNPFGITPQTPTSIAIANPGFSEVYKNQNTATEARWIPGISPEPRSDIPVTLSSGAYTTGFQQTRAALFAPTDTFVDWVTVPGWTSSTSSAGVMNPVGTALFSDLTGSNGNVLFIGKKSTVTQNLNEVVRAGHYVLSFQAGSASGSTQVLNRVGDLLVNGSPLSVLNWTSQQPASGSGGFGGITQTYRIDTNSSLIGQTLAIRISSESAQAYFDNVSLTFTPLSFQQWKADNKLDPTLTDNDDADGNGVPLLFEYALGITRGSTNLSRLPVFGSSGNNMTLSYEKLRSDITYTVEKSTDLQTWTTTGINQGAAMGSVQASVPMEGTKTFLRLRVNRP